MVLNAEKSMISGQTAVLLNGERHTAHAQAGTPTIILSCVARRSDIWWLKLETMPTINFSYETKKNPVSFLSFLYKRRLPISICFRITDFQSFSYFLKHPVPKNHIRVFLTKRNDTPRICQLQLLLTVVLGETASKTLKPQNITYSSTFSAHGRQIGMRIVTSSFLPPTRDIFLSVLFPKSRSSPDVVWICMATADWPAMLYLMKAVK
ncbi:hypothetical protein AVEN_187878-1 [Araneus ventricosus]|uniref:Uncharacterized protein n=1 Tax=Araneus ventricosus TaxID=182803 RepID=A0A4Y2CU01_ARAVE|nr:hypothetical protein AVEN_187878-1 [Araneus ventricosus]